VTALLNFSLTPGERLKRRELHERYGGSRQNGISSAPRSGCILLFTGDAGHQFGYDHDGPQADGSFHYTGEGQVNDQELIRGNAAIARGDRPLLLFRMVGGGVVEYLGRLRVDAEQPYYRTDAPDRTKAIRSVLVFKLWPLDRVSEPLPAFERSVRQVPLERHETTSGRVEVRTETVEFWRREAGLVQRYQAFVGRTLVRNAIPLPGTAVTMWTDIYDPMTGELIEAKGSAARFHVRMALGQLLDYKRSVNPKSLAVLLHEHPGDDLVSLLHENNVTCIHETQGTFVRLSPPQRRD